MPPTAGAPALDIRPLALRPHARSESRISHRVKGCSVTATKPVATEGELALAAPAWVRSRDLGCKGDPMGLRGTWSPGVTGKHRGQGRGVSLPSF